MDQAFEIFGFGSAILMGVTLGLLGGGGSILTVPIFIYLFRLNVILATGYSLFVVGLSALLGSLRYKKRKEVNYKVGVYFALPSMIGVYLSRQYIVPSLPDEIIQLGSFLLTKDTLILMTFASIMFLASLTMIRGRGKLTPTKEIKFLLVSLEGLVVGVVIGFVGAGGGFLIVPSLVLLCGLEIKTAIGTSLTIIAVNSLIGFIGDVQTQVSIDWLFLLKFSGLALVGVLFGAYFSTKVSSEKLKPLFGYFVLLMALFIFYQQLSGKVPGS